MKPTPASIRAFREAVFAHYEAHGRHNLPWRKTRDPYRILVSEVMLQQTQVDRVIPFYAAFLKAFPTARALAEAPLGQVLTEWQGLGYNRRAKMLRNAAKEIMGRWKGKFPKNADDIESLPGVGPYTARAVAAFAYNQDSAFVETNIRTALMHHFFRTGKVSDSELMPILDAALPRGKSREWYSALMDYGAALKRAGLRTNARVAGYAKQKKFEGSSRQARGAILRALVPGPFPVAKVSMLLGREREVQMKSALAALVKEGMVRVSRRKASLL